MNKIPHGKTLKERKEYATRMKQVAYSYYENGSWTVKRLDPNVVLVEVWEQAGQVSIHPSRNRFFWVQQPQQRQKLHSLATDPTLISMFQSGADAGQARPGKVKLEPVTTSKVLAAPKWALAANVIGYTSTHAITFVADGIGISIHHLRSFPSIYYKSGHVTIDHPKPGNIGWVDWTGGSTCLFFGNVPRSVVFDA